MLFRKYSTTNSKAEKAENFKLENDLQKIIERLRQELEELYCKEGLFLNPTVLQMSQQLDEYIVAFQKLTKH
ncbi:aspartyl-phosphate phosphatase Spo0E family protein [Brevibacillus laterosporus]|nr:aspartyl-phosphate phosphatase Spo0E family protein [Brevibacillus laterosporus]TPG69298.1 aspartyl-phosphate phosphatase Spo0E family protein [Brevibacillus laterosporus]TPG88466.1 aspartyl-phosphate phosphatase Spo0E family protein [Brevibacillus laterosporus]